MSLNGITQSLNFSNITDAFNDAVVTIKQQPSYIQAAVAGAALAAIGLVTFAFYAIAKKLFGGDTTEVNAAFVTKTEGDYKAAKDLSAALSKTAESTQKTVDDALKIAASKGDGPKAELARHRANKTADALAPLSVAANQYSEQAKVIADKLVTDSAIITANKGKITAADASEKSAAESAIRTAAKNIEKGLKGISDINAKYTLAKNSLTNVDTKEEDLKKAVKSEESNIRKPMNFVNNNAPLLVLAAVSTGFAVYSYFANVPALVVAAATGAAASSADVTAAAAAAAAAAAGAAAAAVEPSTFEAYLPYAKYIAGGSLIGSAINSLQLQYRFGPVKADAVVVAPSKTG